MQPTGGKPDRSDKSGFISLMSLDKDVAKGMLIGQQEPKCDIY